MVQLDKPILYTDCRLNRPPDTGIYINSTDYHGWAASESRQADLDNYDRAGYRTPDSNENHKGQVNCRAITSYQLQNASQARARRNSVAIAVGRLPPDLHCWSHILPCVYKHPTNIGTLRKHPLSLLISKIGTCASYPYSTVVFHPKYAISEGA